MKTETGCQGQANRSTQIESQPFGSRSEARLKRAITF